MIKKVIKASDKKKITSDWNDTFPSLGIYKPMHLMNRVGPLICGILLEVKSGGETYIPTFHVHNLTKPFETITLSLKYEFESIGIEWHEKKYQERAAKIMSNTPIPLQGDVLLSEILAAYEEYLSKNIGGPYLPYVFEDIVLLSAWGKDRQRIQKGLTLAESQMKVWPERILAKLGGLDNWLSTLESKAGSNREDLLKIYEEQSIKLKVDKTPERNLIC